MLIWRKHNVTLLRPPASPLLLLLLCFVADENHTIAPRMMGPLPPPPPPLPMPASLTPPPQLPATEVDDKRGVAVLMETTKENVIAAAVRTNDKNNNNVESERQAAGTPPPPQPTPPPVELGPLPAVLVLAPTVPVAPARDKYIILPSKRARSNDLDGTKAAAAMAENNSNGIIISPASTTLPAEMGQDFDPYGESLITY